MVDKYKLIDKYTKKELIDLIKELTPLEDINVNLPNNVSHYISSLSTHHKNILFSTWMMKERVEGSKDIDIMLTLDDEWKRMYQKYRISDGFYDAAVRANKKILDIIYGS